LYKTGYKNLCSPTNTFFKKVVDRPEKEEYTCLASKERKQKTEFLVSKARTQFLVKKGKCKSWKKFKLIVW
jgi:hypothetical protein